MSQDDKKKLGNKPLVGDWGHLKNPSPQPKGPKQPWPQDIDEAADDFIEFLKNSEGKKAIKDFLINTYKEHESERLAALKSRIEHEKSVDSRSSVPHHQPGNLEPMMHEDLSMTETEHAFARSLKTTKARLVRSVEERVDEINRLLADIGGFSAQLKSSFARSTVVFLEQEDPKHNFRERLIFSINLPNYELKRSWDRTSGKKKQNRNSDGRTSLQVTWDESVNALAKIVETTGLKPKYCKNDRHYGRFVMKQDLRSTTNIPDEYFSFTLDYNTEEKIREMYAPYDKVVNDYETKIDRLAKKLNQYPDDSKSPKYLNLKKQHLILCQDRDFFVGTTPDPHQLDEGLLFLIEVSTLKDYHIVKDRMQSIMTRYILYLSKVATKESAQDPDLEYELAKAERQQKQPSAEELKDPVEDLPEYLVDSSLLKSVNPSLERPEPLARRKKKIA
jgi:hypothetical protein